MEVRTYQIGMREYSTESAARQLQEREAVRPAAVSAKRKKKTGKRHVSRSLTMRGYAVFFAAACLVTMILLNQYLMLQSSVRRHTRAVSGLRMQLESILPSIWRMSMITPSGSWAWFRSRPTRFWYMTGRSGNM